MELKAEIGDTIHVYRTGSFGSIVYAGDAKVLRMREDQSALVEWPDGEITIEWVGSQNLDPESYIEWVNRDY